MTPKYNLDKIKFGTDASTWEKAVGLYEKGKVVKVRGDEIGFAAIVLGGDKYRVYVHGSDFARGVCECYLGQQDILCKHMVALAIHAVLGGSPLLKDDAKSYDEVVCSSRVGVLTNEELSNIKKQITEAMRYIKAYSGPSKTWFAYQGSLAEGVARLTKIVSELRVSKQTAELVVDVLIRVDKKLCEGGVDDSDGIVGGFIQETVGVLKEYANLDSKCVEAFKKLEGRSTCFGWEEPLVNMVEK